MKTSDTSSQHNTVDQLVAEFKHTLQVSWELPGDLAHQAIKLLNSVGQNTICPETKRRHLLISLVRSKFHANRSRAQSFIDAAAKNKRYFDPQTKAQITLLFDRAERADFDEWAKSEQLPAGLLHLFEPVSEEEALEHLGGQLTDAKINRSDARTGVQEERRQSILRSLFGSWIFQVVEPRKAMAFNAKLPVEEIEEDYFNHLQRHYPKVLGRPCGAYAIAVSGRQIQKLTAGNLRAVLYKEIQAAYKQLRAHDGIL